MSQSAQAVANHYKKRALGDVMLAALKAAGKDIEHLTPDDLAAVDEVHSGGRNATGGQAQLADKVSSRQGNALELPFPDASFDLVWSQNAAMNIGDRDCLYGEMRRVLTPAGRLAFQDVAAGPGGDLHYPAPWANDKSISFLFTPQSTRAALERIGFRVLAWHDSTQEALEQQLARAKALESGSLPPLGLHILIGEAYPAVIKNMLRNLQEQRIALLNAVLERV